MLKQKRFILILSIVIALALIAAWQKPKLVYLRELVEAKLHTNVSGPTTVHLDVPFYKQEHSLSCEIASLRMALAGVGVMVTESELISLLPFDRTPKQNGIWGDPYTGFVGNIDGKQPHSGYGVYWQPIADLGNKFRRSEVIENATAQDLTKHLSDGNPIIYWGTIGSGKTISWHTPEGKKIDGINGEHARTITGFTGTPESPDGFFVIDPVFGKMFWKTADLLKNGQRFNSSGVVVFKD